MCPGIERIDGDLSCFGCIVAANQGFGETMRMMHVIEAEAAFHAEPIAVRGTIAAVDMQDFVVLDLVGDLATDAAIWADALDLAIMPARKHSGGGIDQGRRHQRAGRASLDALPAGDASRAAHRVVHVEHDLLRVTAPGHADRVVDLHLTAGAHTEIAVDAGIQLHRHRGMAAVGAGTRPLWEPALGHADPLGPAPETGIRIVCGFPLRLIGHQKFEHHFTGSLGALARGLHLHAASRLANAGSGEDALALDLDHAGAAIAVGAIARCRTMAEMRDFDAEAVRHRPDGLARRSFDLLPVERESDGVAHFKSSRKYL